MKQSTGVSADRIQFCSTDAWMQAIKEQHSLAPAIGKEANASHTYTSLGHGPGQREHASRRGGGRHLTSAIRARELLIGGVGSPTMLEADGFTFKGGSCLASSCSSSATCTGEEPATSREPNLKYLIKEQLNEQLHQHLYI